MLTWARIGGCSGQAHDLEPSGHIKKVSPRIHVLDLKSAHTNRFTHVFIAGINSFVVEYFFFGTISYYSAQ